VAKDSPTAIAPVHPVYLNVPMMISFLASVQGGVTFEDETTRRMLTGTQRDREGSGALRVPALSSLLGFDMSGRMAKSERGEEAEEVKAVRQHTAASLFNALLEHLRESGHSRTIAAESDLADVHVGDLVEVTGAFVGNPFEDLLALFGQFIPYLQMEEPTAGEERKGPKHPRRSGNPATRAHAKEVEQQRAAEALEQALEAQRQEFGIRVLRQMREDVKTAPVHDTVLHGPESFPVVLTMSAEFFSETVNEDLKAGYFTALGKVTRVLSEGEEINLTRRTVLGAANPDLARSILESANDEEEGLKIDTSDPVVNGPALQLLPLAIFV
jgi:hypothetical protein